MNSSNRRLIIVTSFIIVLSLVVLVFAKRKATACVIGRSYEKSNQLYVSDRTQGNDNAIASNTRPNQATVASVSVKDQGGHASQENNMLSPLPSDKPNPFQIKHAVTYGARGKVTLHVIDSMGRGVSDAIIQGGFYNNGQSGHGFKEKTESSGLVTLENDCTGDLNFWAEKKGYYRTDQRYWFFKNGFDCVKDGRWMPWNPTITVVLKEKRKPVQVVIKRVDAKLPKDERAGFDCLLGDWLPPLGSGKMADISFLYRSDYNGIFGCLTNSLTITTDFGGGFIKLKQDAFSQLWSVYEAPESGYVPELFFEHARTPETILKDVTLSKNDYLVFHSRAGKIPGWGLVGAYYGKLNDFEYGEDYKKPGFGFIKFTYYFNSHPNDRNLEAEQRAP